jgi:predicted transcriptional regulator
MSGRSKYPRLLSEFGSVQELLDALEGRQEALINKLGEEVAVGLLEDRFAVRLEDNVVVIIEAILTRLTEKGILIPSRETRAKICDPNYSYQLQQLKLNREVLERGYARLAQLGLVPGMALDVFVAKALVLLRQLRKIKNADRAVCFPILIPQMDIKDLGETTELLVSTVATAYQQQFPGRLFTNHRKGSLAGRVVPFQGAGYDQLMADLRNGPVVGLWFPSSMLGFSLDAQQEQAEHLPSRFTLTGTIEAAIGWVMYTELVAANIRTPLYDCPAVRDGSSGQSFCFGADDDRARFRGRIHPVAARGGCSGGLLFR